MSEGPGVPEKPAFMPREFAAELRDAISRAAGEVSALVRDLGSTQSLTAGGVWTVRETAVHLVACGHLYASLLTGHASPLTDRSQYGVLNSGAFLALAETRPAALADLIDAGARAFLDAFTGVSPDQPRPWHYGREVPCAIHAALLADEYLMHGTDIAKAADILWDGDQVAAGTVCRVLVPWLTPLRWLPHDGSLSGKLFAVEPTGQRAMAFLIGGDVVALAEEPRARPDCMVTGPAMGILRWYFQREPWESAGLTADGPGLDMARTLSDHFRPL